MACSKCPFSLCNSMPVSFEDMPVYVMVLRLAHEALHPGFALCFAKSYSVHVLYVSVRRSFSTELSFGVVNFVSR